MNLKRKLRLLYANQPALRKKSFAGGLVQNAVWQELHPIRALLLTHAWLVTVIVTVSAFAAAGTGVGLIVMMQQAPPPPDAPLEPPVIESTSTASVTTSAIPVTTITTTIMQSETAITSNTTVLTELHTVPATSAVIPKTETSIFSSEPTVTSLSQTTAVQTASTASIQIVRVATETMIPTAVTVPQTSVQTTTAIQEKTTETAPATERNTETRETVTASLCDHTVIHTDASKITYHDCGYPACDVKRALGLNDAQFVGNMILSADQILTGTIQAKQENVIDGNPWTQLTLRVEHCYYGAASETKEIWLAGGIMPLADYLAAHPENTAFSNWDASQIAITDLHEAGAFSRNYNAGESYLWFLSPMQTEQDDAVIWTTTFGSDLTILRQDDIRYVCANPYQSFSMLTDAVEIQIEKLKQIE